MNKSEMLDGLEPGERSEQIGGGMNKFIESLDGYTVKNGRRIWTKDKKGKSKKIKKPMNAEDRITDLNKKSHGLDEIVATNTFFHLERMAEDTIWFSVEVNNKNFHVMLYSDSKIKAKVSEQK